MFPLWIHQAFHMVKLARDLNGGFQGNPSVGFSDSIGYSCPCKSKVLGAHPICEACEASVGGFVFWGGKIRVGEIWLTSYTLDFVVVIFSGFYDGELSLELFPGTEQSQILVF